GEAPGAVGGARRLDRHPGRGRRGPVRGGPRLRLRVLQGDARLVLPRHHAAHDVDIHRHGAAEPVAVGIALVTAPLIIRARDLRYVLKYVLGFWIYLVPIIYPIS